MAKKSNNYLRGENSKVKISEDTMKSTPAKVRIMKANRKGK